MDVRTEQLRLQLPSVAQAAYLNTGSAGPMPETVSEAMAVSLQHQTANPRITMDHVQWVLDGRRRAREAAAGLLGCAIAEVALTTSTSDGMNIATLGLNWQPGDEAITTDVEHAGALLPLYIMRDRFQVTVRVAQVGLRPEAAVSAIERLITRRTRLISVSHVSYSTGAILPVREICEMADKYGVQVLVDGAQTFGAIPLNMQALGCDFYAVSGQKWICGPEGTGALYVARKALDSLRPTFSGYFGIEKHNRLGGMLPKDDANRFEHATLQPAAVAGFERACRWLAGEVGQEYAFSRIQRLAELTRERLQAIPGVQVITSGALAGLVSFTVDGIRPEPGVQALRDKSILIRSIPDNGYLRVSTGFYNTEAEIGRMAEAVAALSHT